MDNSITQRARGRVWGTLSASVVALLLGAFVAGCATPQRVYDDRQIARIQKDVTAEADLVQWFGPATSRTMQPDGSKSLTWRLGTSGRNTGPAGKLDVRLAPDGKVTAYTASQTTK